RDEVEEPRAVAVRADERQQDLSGTIRKDVDSRAHGPLVAQRREHRPDELGLARRGLVPVLPEAPHLLELADLAPVEVLLERQLLASLAHRTLRGLGRGGVTVLTGFHGNRLFGTNSPAP